MAHKSLQKMVSFEWLQEAAFWLCMALSVFLMIWYIFGHSPAIEDLILPVMLGYVINLNVTLSKHIHTTKAGFDGVKKDIAKIHTELQHHQRTIEQVSGKLETFDGKLENHLKGYL